ncbi:MAG: hypothetical protein AAGA25_04675, partial [Planctomycetota bacterium]
IALLVVLLALPVFPKNIDLSTVPDRDTVQLTIYNSADLTLVRETRKVVFKPGNNPLQFSWANTLIDPTSVQLRFLNHAEKLDVLDTTFPHDRPQVLVWNVGSEHAGEAVIEISYFTSGVSWSADYTVIANADESAASVEGFVTVVNNSGESYEGAQVRLVVGTINLVEQITELARRSGRNLAKLEREEMDEFRMRAARQNFAAADALLAESAVAPATAAPKQIVKQGLSEYFIFTIEGTEDIPTNSRKRLSSFAADSAPLEVQYRYRPQQYGHQLVRMFLMTNDTESDMGTSPLPDGQVRVFRQKEDGRGLSFLARQQVKYIPIGDDLELNLGVDPDVGFELITQRTFRDNIWLRQKGVRVLTRVDQPGVQLKDNLTVSGWDQHQVMIRRVRNDTPRPIDVEIRQVIHGDATFISRLDPTRYDNQNVVFGGTLEPGERYDAVYQVSIRQGSNSKQNRVEIVDGDPAELIRFAINQEVSNR